MPVFRAVRSYRQPFGIFFLQLAAIFCPFKALVHRPPYQRLCWQVIRTLCKEERPICKTTYLDHYWTQDGILLWRAQGMVVWLVLSFSYILLHAIDSDLPQMKVWFKHFIFPVALGSEISCRGPQHPAHHCLLCFSHPVVQPHRFLWFPHPTRVSWVLGPRWHHWLCT